MEKLSIFEKPRTKAKRVEDLLRSRGLRGVDNSDLNAITFRYGAVIFNLRKDGHDIKTGPMTKTGLVYYYWIK